MSNEKNSWKEMAAAAVKSMAMASLDHESVLMTLSAKASKPMAFAWTTSVAALEAFNPPT